MHVQAILGGRCVDTGEQLGPPLTGLVHTYLSVCGVQKGTNSCAFSSGGVCNPVDGMKCNSAFLCDINAV